MTLKDIFALVNEWFLKSSNDFNFSSVSFSSVEFKQKGIQYFDLNIYTL